MFDELKTMLIDAGATIVGVADLADVPHDVREGYPAAVSIGVRLSPRIIHDIAGGPTAQYAEEYDRVNTLLNTLAETGAAWLIARGHHAMNIAATIRQFDKEKLAAPFSNKMPATLAGLGWIGKCDLLVTPEYGSAVRWSCILTDAPLPAGKPITESRCGHCRNCADICPGQAASGKNWRRGMTREDLWDAHACHAAIGKINKNRDLRRKICGMCIPACPYTRAYLKRQGHPIKNAE